MFVQEGLGLPQHTNCESCITTELTSTLEGNSTYSDGKLYDLEMDIRSGYHMVVPLNSSYDNVSNKICVAEYATRYHHAETCHVINISLRAVVTRISKPESAIRFEPVTRLLSRDNTCFLFKTWAGIAQSV